MPKINGACLCGDAAFRRRSGGGDCLQPQAYGFGKGIERARQTSGCGQGAPRLFGHIWRRILICASGSPRSPRRRDQGREQKMLDRSRVKRWIMTGAQAAALLAVDRVRASRFSGVGSEAQAGEGSAAARRDPSVAWGEPTQSAHPHHQWRTRQGRRLALAGGAEEAIGGRQVQLYLRRVGHRRTLGADGRSLRHGRRRQGSGARQLSAYRRHSRHQERYPAASVFM